MIDPNVQNRQFDYLIGKLKGGQLPINEGTLSKLEGMGFLNPDILTKLTKQRMLKELESAYYRRGEMTPIEKFGRGTEAQLPIDPQF